MRHLEHLLIVGHLFLALFVVGQEAFHELVFCVTVLDGVGGLGWFDSFGLLAVFASFAEYRVHHFPCVLHNDVYLQDLLIREDALQS